MKGWLTGWKAISSYIDRSVKTAKKYHKKYGLPVRRGPKGMPMAIIKELDKWLVMFDERRSSMKNGTKFPQRFPKNTPL